MPLRRRRVALALGQGFDERAELADQPERAQPSWPFPIAAVARARLSLAFGVFPRAKAMKQTATLLLTIATILLMGSCFGGRGRLGARIGSCEIKSARFSVRITHYAEEGGFLPGAYYRFESSAIGMDSWEEITTFRMDDTIDMPCEQIRFVNEEIGYVFLGWIYAVTTDGGQTWSVWNAERDFTGRHAVHNGT